MLEPTKVEVELTKDQKGAQVRESINEATVTEYVERIESGVKFPPIIAFFDGNNYWIADGWHRLMAHERSGCLTISAKVKSGGERDALQYALSANSAHGLPRTNPDKRNAVKIALADTEWSKLSTREIAKLCAVSHNLVAEVQRGFSPDDCTKRRNNAQAEQSNVEYDPLLAPPASPSTASPQRPELVAKFSDQWRIAELRVMHELQTLGYTVEDHSRQKVGYDLYATKDNRVHYIEVKLLKYAGDPFVITTHEQSIARHYGERYTLALILPAKDGVFIQWIHNPTTKLRFDPVVRQTVMECSEYEFDPKFYEEKAP